MPGQDQKPLRGEENHQTITRKSPGFLPRVKSRWGGKEDHNFKNSYER
jgi:hypothetical protein